MKSSSVSLWYAKYGLLFCYAFAQFVICSNVRVGILLIQCYHYLVKPHKLCICIHEEWILLCWSGVNTNSLDSVQFRFRTQKKLLFLVYCHPMLCGVCPSITFMNSVKTSNPILGLFLLLGSQTILVFPYQTAWQYSDGNPANGGVECRWGRQKSHFLTSMWLHHVLSTLRPPAWHHRTVASCDTYRW